ncbi:MAG: hypothetical protein KAV00_08300, partial [Phycisphaerae bacterium]|nr:hypothetical protein [Phycisphaerae bacterium]
PPADTERIMQTSARRLVGWTRRDEQTKAVRWSLEVLRTKHKPTKLPLSKYAKTVAAELSRTSNFKVKSTRTSIVAGKPAIHFSGTWSGAFELWRRQTWVRIKPGEHIILNISGDPNGKDEMDAVMTKVLGSLKLFDPKIAAAEYKQNLARGASALKKLSIRKLQTIINKKPCYCTIKLKGKIIGFVKLTESITKRSNAQGLNVVSSGALILPETPAQLTWKELFTTPDRNFEQWKQVSVQGKGKTAAREIQEAIRKDNWMLVQLHRSGRPKRNWKQELPKTLHAAYLPEALSNLLPRLLDRSKPGTYAFAVYNPGKNDFDMRTVQVVKTETIRMGPKNFKATRMTDQMSRQSPIVNLWVDEKGLLLRMQMPGGLVMERADRRIIAAKFAAELAELDKLRRSKGKRNAGK